MNNLYKNWKAPCNNIKYPFSKASLADSLADSEYRLQNSDFLSFDIDLKREIFWMSFKLLRNFIWWSNIIYFWSSKSSNQRGIEMAKRLSARFRSVICSTGSNLFCPEKAVGGRVSSWEFFGHKFRVRPVPFLVFCMLIEILISHNISKNKV